MTEPIEQEPTNIPGRDDLPGPPNDPPSRDVPLPAFQPIPGDPDFEIDEE
jgi:hypothetical protein